MNFLEELQWRGMIHQMTPGTDALLQDGMITGYIGFDPTAPSLTIGNYVQIMLLRLFQDAGHRPIILMGGATGRIGDPSGKDKERELKSYDELDHNLEFQSRQFARFLDFEGPNAAIIVNNLDFYRDMNVLDFLRQVGKTLTVNYMSSKDSVKKRLETGLSFTEFSYQLLQAYDFQCLYTQHDCRLQMGGSDQWGNITSGTEFIRRNVDGKAHAVTTPLLTKADGSKFGKSERGNIWLSPELTSPYQFFQFWLKADDADLRNYIRYFSLRPREEMQALLDRVDEDPISVKAQLAEELTVRVHSRAAYESVLSVSELLFNKKANRDTLLGLDETSLATVAQEIPSFQIERDQLAAGINIVDLLAEHTSIQSSKGEARRSIKGNAIAVNKEKIKDHEYRVDATALLHGKYLMVENGRKNKFIIVTQ
ncbi:MAG: tyrosine--tRNA ligase [Bacteroidota bacterium]